LWIFNSSQNTISSNHSDLPASRLTGATPSGWVESINSPLIQEDGDNKMLKLRFDVSQYEPEEIVVKTVDNKLLVCVNNIVHVTFLPVFVCSAAQSKIILCAVTWIMILLTLLCRCTYNCTSTTNEISR